LKFERLLLKTLHTTTVGDSTFLKNIHVSLLLDPLALKFKQSFADFRPQNGQIEISNSQTLDLEILDPESLDFKNSNLRINRSHEGERPQDDIDPRF
jgi:alpha-acetolactate decarboxylase